jgi:hypothetical protein
MKRGQTGVTEPIPPTITSMGRFFLFREVNPRGDVPGNLFFFLRRQEVLARMSDNESPSQVTT